MLSFTLHISPDINSPNAKDYVLLWIKVLCNNTPEVKDYNIERLKTISCMDHPREENE